MCSFFFWSGEPELLRMNNSPAGWWKEGSESVKRWGGVTLVPAGCRSPGRCRGNHSHQPDGISVGEHEKDGSRSVLPGPAKPRNELTGRRATWRAGRKTLGRWLSGNLRLCEFLPHETLPRRTLHKAEKLWLLTQAFFSNSSVFKYTAALLPCAGRTLLCWHFLPPLFQPLFGESKESVGF